MAGFGELLLNITGRNGGHDPRKALLAQLLGSDGGTPGASAPATPAAPAGVATPGSQPGTAPAAATPQAYQSPPDLLTLYSELTDRESRAKRIDTGLGLIGASFSQPQNRQMVYDAVTGTSGDPATPGGAFGLVTKVAEMQAQQKQAEAAAEAAARQRAAVPVIAEQLGIPVEQAQALFDAGGLDELLGEKYKPRVTSMADGNGQIVTIDQNTGAPLGGPAGAAKTPEPKRRVIDDKATGRQWLVDDATGEVVQEYMTGLDPTVDQQQYNIAKQQGYSKTFEQWLIDEANRKKSSTVINNNLGGGPDRALVEGSDMALRARGDTARTAVNTISQLQTAQNFLNAPGGVITGSKWAPIELEARKLFADAFGVTDPAIINSANYAASMGDVLRSKVKELGTGNSISNADREYTEKSIGAGGEIPAEAMPRILAINEFGSRNEIIKYNRDVEARLNASKDASGQVDSRVATSLEKIPVPPISDAWMGFVHPDDLAAIEAEIKSGSVSKESRREFDKLYGPNATDAVVERLTNG